MEATKQCLMSMKERLLLARDKKPRLSKGEDPLVVGEVLNVVLKGLNIDVEEPQFGLTSSWAEIAGADLALHVSVVDIQHTTLVLRADHPSWANVVMLQKRRIIKAIGERYPGLGIINLHVLGA